MNSNQSDDEEPNTIFNHENMESIMSNFPLVEDPNQSVEVVKSTSDNGSSLSKRPSVHPISQVSFVKEDDPTEVKLSSISEIEMSFDSDNAKTNTNSKKGPEDEIEDIKQARMPVERFGIGRRKIPTSIPELTPETIEFHSRKRCCKRKTITKKNNAIYTPEQLLIIKDMGGDKFPGEKKTKKKAPQSFNKLLSYPNNIQIAPTRIERKENMDPTLNKSISYKLRKSIKNLKILFVEHSVFPPDQKIRVSWDLFGMVLILYELIMIPMKLSFDFETDVVDSVDNIINFFFMFDIILTFNTGYYDKGVLRMDRRDIILAYIKGWFWIDLLASFPYDYAIDGGDQTSLLKIVRIFKFLKVLRLLRVLKLKNIFSKVENYMNLSVAISGIIGFLKLAILILFLSHWCGCLFHIIGVDQYEQTGDGWLVRYDLLEASYDQRYVASIYWSTATMLTVGYGDITPVTRDERIFGIAVMLISSSVFAYTLNKINIILQGLDNVSMSNHEMMQWMSNFMRKKGVDRELQIKIKKYLEYALAEETTSASNNECINRVLSEALRTELLTDIYGKSIVSDNLLTKLFDPHFLLELSQLTTESFHSPGEIVASELNMRDLGLYIISSGKSQVYALRSNTVLSELKHGSRFGEISFFTGTQRKASLKALDFTTVCFIPRNEVLELIDNYPDQKEKFFLVKDKILFYNDMDGLKIACYFCKEHGHISTKCPKIHYSIRREEIINEHLYEQKELARKFPRSNLKYMVKGDKYKQMREAAVMITDNNIFKNSAHSKFVKVVQEIMNAKTLLKLKVGQKEKSKPMIASLRKEITKANDKIDIFENDIDQVCNFTHYFPWNNVRNQYPDDSKNDPQNDYGMLAQKSLRIRFAAIYRREARRPTDESSEPKNLNSKKFVFSRNNI